MTNLSGGLESAYRLPYQHTFRTLPRMHMRRLTRLTNAFSKKWYNLKAAFALQFAYYNLCRVHQTLRCAPAMEARITEHVWEISELLG